MQVTVTTDAERVDKLQAEIDDCRAFIRRLGVSGFGSLLEGIEMIASQEPELDEIEVSDEQIRGATERIRASAARLSTDESYRTLMPFKTEVLQIALAMCSSTLRVDPHDILIQIERQLARYIMVIKKEREWE